MTAHIESCGIDTCGDGRECSCWCHSSGQVVEQALELLREMKPEARVDVLRAIESVFCPDCGYDQPRGRRSCQCSNDE